MVRNFITNTDLAMHNFQGRNKKKKVIQNPRVFPQLPVLVEALGTSAGRFSQFNSS